MPKGQMKRATLLILAATAPLTLAFAPIVPSSTCMQRNHVTLRSTTEEKAASSVVEVEDNPRKLGLALMLDDGECLF
jgi:hypothetical protein